MWLILVRDINDSGFGLPYHTNFDEFVKSRIHSRLAGFGV
jgi:hypothetical protein